MSADSCSIIEYRDGKYKFVAWENFDDNIIKDIEKELNLTKPVNLEKIREKKSIMKIDDVYKLSYWIKIENVRSYIGSPIIYKDEVIAILNVDSKNQTNFLNQMLQILKYYLKLFQQSLKRTIYSMRLMN